jgi:hypothetical protein
MIVETENVKTQGKISCSHLKARCHGGSETNMLTFERQKVLAGR